MQAAIRDQSVGAALWWSAIAATGLGLLVVWSVPLIAFATGAYYVRPTVRNVLLLLWYVSPVAVPVLMPTGIALGVLAVCRRPSDIKRLRFPAALLVVIGTIVATVLFVWIAPLASQAFRDVAAPRGIEMRLNLPGSPGYQLLRDEGWAILCANVVLGAFAMIASTVARGRVEIRFAAAAAAIACPFLYPSIGALALQRLLPILLAAWLPNLMFAAVTVLLSCLHVARPKVAATC